MGRAAVAMVQNDDLIDAEEGIQRGDVPQHGADPAGHVPEGDAFEPLQAQDRVRVGARVQAGDFQQVALVICEHLTRADRESRIQTYQPQRVARWL